MALEILVVADCRNDEIVNSLINRKRRTRELVHSMAKAPVGSDKYKRSFISPTTITLSNCNYYHDK